MDPSGPQANRPSLPPLTRKRLLRTWGFVRPSWRGLLAVFLLSVTGAALGLAMPLLVQRFVDGVLVPPHRAGLILPLSLIVAGLVVGRSLVSYLQAWAATHLATRVLFRLRQAFFEHLQGLPIDFFSKTRSGAILTRFGRDTAEIQEAACGAVISLLMAALTIAGTVALLVHLSPRLFLLSCLVLPPAFLAARAHRRRLVDRTHEVRRSNEEMASFLVESLRGRAAIRALAQEKKEAARFVGLQARLIRRVLAMVRVGAAGAEWPRILIGLSSVAVFGYGALLVTESRLLPGELLAFGILQSRVFGPIQGLAGLYLRLQRARVSMERIFSFLETPLASLERPDARRAPSLEGSVAMEDIHFAYGDAPEILRGVNLTIPPGGKVGLFGPSGGGKSTLVSLLFRLRIPDRGRILLDGADLMSYTVKSVNRQVALVTQEPFLLHASFLENVRLARPDATREEVSCALEAVGLGALIEGAERGLDSQIGERGLELSAGERQRLVLARVLVQNPRILVLDEAMSHLDPSSEAQVRRVLEDLMKERTTLTISHRPESLAHCDAVYALEDGRLRQHEIAR